eukprot:scaffold2908_cov257-Pinguiococcus_pyrenoidosus.AAC.24
MDGKARPLALRHTRHMRHIPVVLEVIVVALVACDKVPHELPENQPDSSDQREQCQEHQLPAVLALLSTYEPRYGAELFRWDPAGQVYLSVGFNA